jgi:hypothetical protein
MIMEFRQYGMPIADLMASIEVGSGDENVDKLTEILVLQAYDIPRYNKPNMQQRAIQDFSDMAFKVCYENSQE